ncbi:hypothetical protein [Novimethylophilus kurashikiensis]|uniref:hypothetical protein n=1 Tax=Novimethylophilus kurashikiensis TaxID=1825523 RepID=UPI00223E30F6|nr:hypothetical protein [Novimethylophilus kurashikiensis]
MPSIIMAAAADLVRQMYLPPQAQPYWLLSGVVPNTLLGHLLAVLMEGAVVPRTPQLEVEVILGYLRIIQPPKLMHWSWLGVAGVAFLLRVVREVALLVRQVVGQVVGEAEHNLEEVAQVGLWALLGLLSKAVVGSQIYRGQEAVAAISAGALAMQVAAVLAISSPGRLTQDY